MEVGLNCACVQLEEEDKMATLYSRSVKFLKLAWVQQPVLFVSSVIGALGEVV